MFSWGEDWKSSAETRAGAGAGAGTGAPRSEPGQHIRCLSVGHNVLSFLKNNNPRNVFIIRTNEAKDGRRVKGRQKCVQCRECIQTVSCGDDDVVYLLSDQGSVFSVDTSHHPFTPRPVAALRNIPVRQLACGSHHTVALTNDGRVYTWGQNSRGQLGLGTSGGPGTTSPTHLSSLAAMPLVQVAAGGEQSFALTASGGVFGWGGNQRGQLGLGDTRDRASPTPVNGLNRKRIVRISCGRDHTVTLTKDGAVFTFGSGQFGQLGHNSFTDELRPRLVVELFGAKVTEIACGLLHTLVLTAAEKVYSFGCGEQGQLGHGGESHPSVPLPVQLPQGSDDGPKVKSIFAGGNCSLATVTSDEEVQDGVNTGDCQDRCLDDLIDKWTTKCDPKSWKKIKQEINKTFATASCLNRSFLDTRKDKHFQTSAKCPGLNLSLAKCAFKKLVKKEEVLAAVEAAVLRLLSSSYTNPVGLEGLRIFLLLNELLREMQRHEQTQSTDLAAAVAAALLRLSSINLHVIGNWWTSLSASTMIKYVKVWMKVLDESYLSKPDDNVRNVLRVLKCIYDANNRTRESEKRIPDRLFHLPFNPIFLTEDLALWNSDQDSLMFGPAPEPLIICRFPMVMDLQSKKFILDTYAEFMKNKSVGPLLYQIFLTNPHLELHLTRASIVEDTFRHLAVIEPINYRKQLVVFLDGNPQPSYVYKYDLFHDVFHEIFTKDYGMFNFNDSKTLAWFPSTATHDHKKYFLFGVLCGLALYNQCIVHLPFPMALFKKLLSVRPTLEDMMEFCPATGRSLQLVLDEYSDQDFENMYMDFSMSWDGKTVDLDPKNPERAVTSQNKKEFVDAYLNYAFNTSVESVFQEFRRGFFSVCNHDLVSQFHPRELQEVLVGKDFSAWERLKQCTSYEGSYHARHPIIMMFWEVFDELTEEQKKTFLWFVTGFDRLPILGQTCITMTIRVKEPTNLSEDDYYPEALTCHSFLDLPRYSTKEIMQSRLTEALCDNRRNYK